LEIARGRGNCPLRVVKRDLGGLLGQRFHHPDAVLGWRTFLPIWSVFDVHVALELCETVIESATIGAVLPLQR
jgi:hypothetical protein